MFSNLTEKHFLERRTGKWRSFKDQKNYSSGFIGKVMKINTQHRKRDKVSEFHIDLVGKAVYVKLRNKLIIVSLHQHKGDRSIRKAIKRSMELKDSFVCLEITNAKECI